MKEEEEEVRLDVYGAVSSGLSSPGGVPVILLLVKT